MMLNDIIAIRDASDKRSGTGRPHALKDGTFAGMGLFSNDPEAQQKNFLSVLSQLGTGTIQVTAEESNNANLKLAEDRLTDDARADNAVAGKSKTKTDKNGGVVKRLPSVYPETLGLVMGLMSIPEPPQPGPSADPALHAPGAENEQEIISDLSVGKILPETPATQGLPGERNSQSGNLSMTPALDDSNRVRAVPVKGLTKDPGQRPESLLTPELVPSRADLSKSDLSKSYPAGTESAESDQVEPGLTETGLSKTGLVQTAEVISPRMFKGRRQPDVATVPEPDLSGRGRLQPVPVEGTPKLHRQQRKPLSISDTVNLNPSAEKIDPGVKGDQAQRLSSDQSMDAAVREKVPTDQTNVPDIRPQAVKVKSASFYPAIDAIETVGIAATSAGTSNADDNEISNMFMAANHSGKIARGENGAHFQPIEPESGELAVNLAGGSQMEKTSWVNSSAKESRTDGQSFHAEVLKQVVEKTSTSLKSDQSEIRIDLKPESLGHLRLHVLTDHQQVTVKILAENPLVKEMIENHASLIKNELQQQGIHVTTVKVEMLMPDGPNFAYSQHEGTASRQARHEHAYGGGKDEIGDSASIEPDSLDQTNNRGGSLVNYFA